MPDMKKEYFFQGGDEGCLVIHGFTSTPAEVYELGENLHRAGYTVLGILLKGHGTDEDDFARATEQDWIASAIEGLKRLRQICPRVYVAGHSMGGLLAMYLAENEPALVDKLILLAPAVVYKDLFTYLAGPASLFMKKYVWPEVERPENEMQYLLGYKTFSTASVHKMTRLQRVVRKNMGKISAPTLLVMAKKDMLVHVKTAEVLTRGMTVKPTLVWLENSGHSVGVECEKEIVFEACVKFLGDKGQ